MRRFDWRPMLLLWIFVSYTAAVNAAFVVSQTRIIYREASRSQSMVVGNSGDASVAIQAWVDSGYEGPLHSAAPFIVSPPMFLLKRGERQVLSVIHNASAMPQDRESLYWLNLLEVPQTAPQDAQDMRINVAVNLQLKLLYRPAALFGDRKHLFDHVTFHTLREGSSTYIAVENRSPFVASFARWDVQLADGHETALSHTDLTILPFSGRRFLLSSVPIPVVTGVRAQLIDDQGASTERLYGVH